MTHNQAEGAYGSRVFVYRRQPRLAQGRLVEPPEARNRTVHVSFMVREL